MNNCISLEAVHTHTHTHTSNFIEINEGKLNAFINNTKSRLSINI